jgi:hypothetical protein
MALAAFSLCRHDFKPCKKEVWGMKENSIHQEKGNQFKIDVVEPMLRSEKSSAVIAFNSGISTGLL